MFVDFNKDKVSYNFRLLGKIEEGKVVVDLNKLNIDITREFVGDAKAFLSVLRAHGYQGCSIIMPEFEESIVFLRNDLQEMGFTIL